MSDLTPAEKAAAEALAVAIRQTTGLQVLALGCVDMARPVVTAVRPHIEADALDALADAATTYGPVGADHLRGIAFTVRQGRKSVRDWLAGDTTEENR